MADIVHRIEIAASPGSVYELVATGGGLERWWAEDVVPLDAGVLELGFFDRTTIYRLRPVTLRPGELATWR